MKSFDISLIFIPIIIFFLAWKKRTKSSVNFYHSGDILVTAIAISLISIGSLYGMMHYWELQWGLSARLQTPIGYNSYELTPEAYYNSFFRDVLEKDFNYKILTHNEKIQFGRYMMERYTDLVGASPLEHYYEYRNINYWEIGEKAYSAEKAYNRLSETFAACLLGEYGISSYVYNTNCGHGIINDFSNGRLLEIALRKSHVTDFDLFKYNENYIHLRVYQRINAWDHPWDNPGNAQIYSNIFFMRGPGHYFADPVISRAGLWVDYDFLHYEYKYQVGYERYVHLYKELLSATANPYASF